MTGAELLAAGVARLRAAGIDGAAGDARRLFAHAARVPQGRVTLVLPEAVAPDAAARFEVSVAARCRHRPVSQITGTRAFHGRYFIVTEDVLDPRPDTETLIGAALARPASRILDIGTGSGCLLLTLLAEWPGATGIGTDISALALAVARRNAIRHRLMRRAAFRRTSWAEGVPGPFDLIVSNPPYIAAHEIAGLAPDVREWEPRAALTPGGDGLDAYRAILPQAAARLAPGGAVLLEMAPWQAGDVAALAHESGFATKAVLADTDGRPRTINLEWR